MGREHYQNETFTKLYNEGLFYKYQPTELSKILGVSRSTLKTWRDGTSFPDIDKLVQISKLLNVSVDYLLGLTDCNSLDGNYQSACAFTGLDEETVKRLNDDKYNEYVVLLLNNIVKSDSYEITTDLLMKAIRLTQTVLSQESRSDAIEKKLVVDGVETDFSKMDLLTLYCNEIGSVISSHLENVLIAMMNTTAEIGQDYLDHDLYADSDYVKPE